MASGRGHCSTSEARCPGRRASEPRTQVEAGRRQLARTLAPPPRPGALAARTLAPPPRPGAPPPRPGAPPPRPGALADALPPLTCRQSEAAALPKMLFFWIFTCGKPSDTRHVLRLQNMTQFQNLRRLDLRADRRLSAVEVHIVSGPLSIRTGPVDDLRLRNSGDSTFSRAKGCLLWKSTSFQVL